MSKGEFARLTPEQRENETVLSPSGLMDLMVTPRHFYYKNILKQFEETPAMAEGKLLHKAILEPDKFGDEYLVLEEKAKYLVTIDDLKNAIISMGEKPKGARKSDLIDQALVLDPSLKIWDVYLKEVDASGLKPVTAEDWEFYQSICDNVKAHRWLGKAMTGGMVEQPAWWRHEASGALISMRMDFYHPSMAMKKPVVIDIKKVRSASPHYFSKQIFENNLYVQAAVYVDGIKAITGEEPLYCWAVVETTPPFCVEVYACDSGSLDAGRAVYHKMINKYFECKALNNWPSYTNGNVQNISIPHWGFARLDEYADAELNDIP